MCVVVGGGLNSLCLCLSIVCCCCLLLCGVVFVLLLVFADIRVLVVVCCGV